jgi:hypothetical protein
MTSRDDRHRKAAQRLRGLVVELAAEVRARGGSLDRYPDLTEEERTEAEEQARGFWRAYGLQVRLRMRQTVAEARRMDSLASTKFSSS